MYFGLRKLGWNNGVAQVALAARLQLRLGMQTECREEIAVTVRVFLRGDFCDQLPSNAFSEARMSTIEPTPPIVMNRKDFFPSAAFL